jgi:hypothetical protein
LISPAVPPDFFARIFLGYMIYDMGAILLFNNQFSTVKDPSIVIHHVAFIFAA